MPPCGARGPHGLTCPPRPPHLAPTGPGTSGPVWGRCPRSSSRQGRGCRSPGRRPLGTPAAGRRSAPPGHRRPSAGGRACRLAPPGRADQRSVGTAAPSTRPAALPRCPGPRPTADLGAPGGAALTLHSRQQAPWAHSAPAASRHEVALQQASRQSWGRRRSGRLRGPSAGPAGSGQAHREAEGAPPPPDLHGPLQAAGDRSGLVVGAAVQGAPTRGGEAAGGGRRAVVGAPYLGLATVALLPTLHKAVPTHGAAHQAVGVRGVGQAAGAGILHEPLQVHLAALAEPPGQWGAAGEGVPSGGWGWWAGHRPPTPGSGPRPGWTSLTQCGPP